MNAKVKTATAYVVLAVYVLILLALLRPGGTGQSAVAATGQALAGLIGV